MQESKKNDQKQSKVIWVSLLSLVCIFMVSVLFDTKYSGNINSVQATSTATTSVRVLNTPPTWTLTARELFPSATTSPTNAGTSTWWTAQATDSNSEQYYLLICKSSSTPTADAGLQPVCGGTGQWAISALTNSGTNAVVSTTTQDAWASKNDWYAYICDANPSEPACNPAMYNGLHEAGPASATSSPFMVNHRPTFTAANDNSPTDPGATTTWTTSSSDPDGDTVQLHICKAQDFNASVPSCGAGGFWASSTFALNNVSAEAFMTPPLQDTTHPAWVYLVDVFGLEASGSPHNTNTALEIRNVAPYVSSSTVQVYDVFGTTTSDQNLVLNVEEGETSNFVVEFQVVDDNSCEAFGGGNEITGADINVFRYNGTNPYTQSLLCDASGEYNANYCYTHTSSSFTPTCYQRPGSCTGPDDADAIWECTFSMWYIADPTDVGSQFPGHDWRASARAEDEALTSSYSTYDGGVDIAGSANMIQFLSFRATGSPIAYGDLEPGDRNPTLTSSTTIYATGNTGIDQYLSGDAMCESFPTCTGNATSTIYVSYQRYSLTYNDPYLSGTQLSTTTSPVLVDVVVPKTLATTSPASDQTFWAIEVPSTITYAGIYYGRNYIDAVVSPSGTW